MGDTTTDDIHSRLGSIEGKLDMLISRDDKMDDRVRAVEKRTWYASGIAVVLSLVAAKLGLFIPPAH